MPRNFNKVMQFQNKIMTDFKSMFNDKLLGTGIDNNIFEAVNDMKKSLLAQLAKQESSIEETVEKIMEMIDNTFKNQIESVVNQ